MPCLVSNQVRPAQSGMSAIRQSPAGRSTLVEATPRNGVVEYVATLASVVATTARSCWSR